MHKENTVYRWVLLWVTLMLLVVSTHAAYAQNIFDALKNGVIDSTKKALQQNAGNQRIPQTPNTGQSANAQPAGTQSFPDQQPPQTGNLSDASQDTGEAAGKDELGPDVLGLRIGMTPARVREIYKSRILLSPELKKSYYERSETLAFHLPNKQLQSVPNGNFYSSFTSAHKENKIGGLYHEFNVSFTAVPGHEKLVSLHRVEWISPSKQPTLSAFLKTLSEKYGAPTYSPPDAPGLRYWFYDKKGTLRKPGTVIKNVQDALTCLTENGMSGAGMAGDSLVGSWTISVPGNPQFRRMASKCGAIVMTMALEIEQGTMLVPSYTTNLFGVESAIRAYDTSQAIIDKARDAAYGSRIKAGDQQKPDL